MGDAQKLDTPEGSPGAMRRASASAMCSSMSVDRDVGTPGHRNRWPIAARPYMQRRAAEPTATRPSDGRMLDMSVRTIGSIHACFGRTSYSTIVNFYGEGALGAA